MTKAEIVGEVSRSTGIDKAIVSTVVESFMESVKESIGKKNNVYLRGFGTFLYFDKDGNYTKATK